MTYVAEKTLKRRTGSTRLREYASPYTQRQKWNSINGSTVNVGEAGSYCYSDTGDEWEGWAIPDYHKRVATGELMPMTPFKRITGNGFSGGDLDVTTWIVPGQAQKGYYRWTMSNGYNPYGHWQVTVNDLAAHAPHAYDMYVGEAAAKIYSNGYDALTALAELAQVKEMFTSVAKRLWKLRLPDDMLRKLLAERYMSRPSYVTKTGIVRKANRGKVVLIKDLMSEWLCVRYGWRTLVYDLISLNETIKNLNAGRTRYSEKVGTKYSTTETSATSYVETAWTNYVTVETKTTVGIRGSVVADIEVPQWQFNPVITAWELIPLSFVLDWVINVGKTLAAYNFLAFQHQYAAAAGYYVKMERSLSVENGSFTSHYRSGYCYQTSGDERTLFIRTPCKVPLLPSLVVRLNSLKVMDLVALVAQRLGSKKGARL